MALATMKILSSKWTRILPAIILVGVLVHLWTFKDSENSVAHSVVHGLLPDHLPWSRPDTDIADIPGPDVTNSKAPQFPGEIEILDDLNDGVHTATTNVAQPKATSHSGGGLASWLGFGSDESNASGQAPLIDKNAHRFTNPDMFKDHFNTVMSLPPLPIAEAKASCSWPADKSPNFQSHESVEWARTDTADTAIQKARKDWIDLMKTGLVPWEEAKGNFSGRGIVIVGGHMKTLPRIKFQLKLLRTYGSRVPVELHYWDKELNATAERELQTIYPYLRTRDLSNKSINILETYGPFMNGYHMKTNAVINSHFAEILLLDADNIPMGDPAYLWNTQTYQEYGTVFWPDISRTRPNNPMWPLTNTPCRMDEYEMESGQMLVDKRRFFYHLQLATYFMKTEFEREYVLGDKDMFRFAWHALKTTFGTPGRWIATIGTRLPEPTPFFCGRSFAQHHPDSNNGSISFLHLNAMKLMAPEVFDYFKDRGGVFEYYKGPPHPQDWADVVPGGLASEETGFLNADPSRPSACIDFYDETEIKTTEVLPNFDRFFRELGGYDVLAETVGR